MESLELDIKNSFIADKIKTDQIYAQNVYAALCNNVFHKTKDWSCSWRYAGGIISEILNKGNYMDWYCSGTFDIEGYLSEGYITNGVRNDIEIIGWIIKEKGIKNDRK